MWNFNIPQNSAKGNAIDEAAIISLLQRFNEASLDVIKTENLYDFVCERGYSSYRKLPVKRSVKVCYEGNCVYIIFDYFRGCFTPEPYEGNAFENSTIVSFRAKINDS